eukprot:GHVS01048138.1.p1 GENE.GHVS01048138.1~~GHVS01048138.1.p1  ORF type:complete len:206 (+),score=24.27 GHVS01048138.1:138-755(+)
MPSVDLYGRISFGNVFLVCIVALQVLSTNQWRGVQPCDAGQPMAEGGEQGANSGVPYEGGAPTDAKEFVELYMHLLAAGTVDDTIEDFFAKDVSVNAMEALIPGVQSMWQEFHLRGREVMNHAGRHPMPMDFEVVSVERTRGAGTYVTVKGRMILDDRQMKFLGFIQTFLVVDHSTSRYGYKIRYNTIQQGLVNDGEVAPVNDRA